MPSASWCLRPGTGWALGYLGQLSSWAPCPAWTRALLPFQRQWLGYHRHHQNHQPAARNWLSVALLGAGNLPFPPLGCPEQQGGRHSPILPISPAAHAAWMVWPGFVSSPGILKAAKVDAYGAVKKPLCDFLHSQSKAPETKPAR